MPTIIDEKYRDNPDGSRLVKTLVESDGHRHWVYRSVKFVPSPTDGPGAGVFVSDPSGFAHSGSPLSRFESAAAQVQSRALDLDPGVSAELADLAKLKAEYPTLYKKLVLAIAAGAQAFPEKHGPTDKPTGKPVPPTFDAGQVAVSLSVCRESPRGLGLTEPEIQSLLSKFQHGDLGSNGPLVPFAELTDEAQWAPPAAGPAAEASAAAKFGSGLVVGKYAVGTRPDDFVLIGTLIDGDASKTLVLASRDNVSF